MSRNAAIARKRRKPKGSFLLPFLIPSLTIVLVGCVGQETIEGQVEIPEGGTLITLVARCKASPPTENARCDNLVAAAQAANAELAARGEGRRIRIQIIQDDKDWGDYKTEFELASDAGQAPDIIVSGHEHIGDWASAGLIIPVTSMFADHPEFAQIIDRLWEATEWKGERWGIPQDADVRPLYYSKLLLGRLGWSDEEIVSLPDRIISGEFTLDAMLESAEEAVRTGVVRRGNGWWHRPVNGPDFLSYYLSQGGEVAGSDETLIFDKKAALTMYRILYSATQQRNILSPTLLGMEWNEWHTVVSSADRVLFSFGGSWNWADWASNYVNDRGGEQFLFENIGFAALPAGATGKPTTLTHPLVYMISSHSEHPDLAILVIAKATTRELNTTYSVESSHLAILKSQADYPPYTDNQFLESLTHLLDVTTFVPNSPYWSTWSEAFFLGIQAVESGELTAEEALEVVVDRLENELGENVVIR